MHITRVRQAYAMRFVAVGLGIVAAAVMLGATAHEMSLHAAEEGAFHYWSAVGSTGTIDSKDLGIYKTSGVTISVPNRASFPAKLNVRFTIPPVRNLIDPPADNRFIGVVYRDNGDDARIVCRLRRVSQTTGAITTLMRFDSDEYAESDEFQRRTAIEVDPGWSYNFSQFSYYLDVIITRRSREGAPALDVVQVGTN